MSDSWKIICSKKTLIVIFVALSFAIFYLYTVVARNKREREKFIKDYDADDNFTNYFLSDVNTEYGIQRYVAKIGNILHMKKKIDKWNKSHKYPIKADVINKVPLVIVLQVNNGSQYLLEFFNSLQKVMGIMNTILIISHGIYDKAINELISNVRFVTVVQIFYPYSMQLHPEVFPGKDKKYCSEGWICKKAKGERNASLAQQKLHWWWKVNYVFDHLDLMKNYNGPVVFLEEDQFVSEDFVYILRILNLAKKSSYHRWDMVGLGVYPPHLSRYDKNCSLVIEEFGSTPFSMGIAFNRTIWNRIKNLRKHFCYYNDYNWVSSLRFLSSRFPEGRLNMLSISGPRVLHFEPCGSPIKDCDQSRILQDFMELVGASLFPKIFSISKSERYTKITKAGYFSDVRDQELCMYFSSGEY